MYGVVCGVHQSEEEGGGGGASGRRAAPDFCKHLQFLPGKREAAPNFWKKKTKKPNNNRLQMNETVCQVQSG